MLTRLHQFITSLQITPGRKDKLIITATIIGIVINIAAWILILSQLRSIIYNLPAEQAFIPLHYNIYLGVDSFGPWQQIFIMPGFGLFVLLINTILALSLFNRKKIISYFLTISSAAVQLFVLIATVLVILINI